MPDFARHLPLSQRRTGDESAVDGDRRTALADIVAQAAALVGSLRSGRAARVDAFAATARLQRELARIGDADPLERLAALAREVRDGRRRSIRALARGARALLQLARELHHPVELDPLTAGAVALYAATTAPLERRAVVRGHTVAADDAEWSFGTGPVLTAPATAIAAFLLGVSDEPPRPPAVTPPR